MLKYFLILLIIFIPKSFAADFHAQYLDWAVFSKEQGNRKVCYTTAVPFKTSGNIQHRGAPYIIVTKTANKSPELSIANGYYYKENSEVELSFGLKKFSMITYKSKAWTYGVDDDLEIIKTMRISDDIVITGVSKGNNISQDHYSLVGFNNAYQELQERCK